MISQSLGHYKVTGRLGEGGMGEVYRARDTKLGRDVAIKMLRKDLVTDEQLMNRFRREARVLASLNHPNIAMIHDFVEMNETSFLVLELVEGETLAERLKRKRMDQRQALDVCRQIAEALGAAHEKGIIHRDLKPGNVKLTTEGKVKVLDFGLAKPVTSEIESGEATTLTGAATLPGIVMGTAPYMSPEQVRGEVLDARTDIWSFGCMMFEMLSGNRPIKGDSVTTILANILMAEPDWKALPSSLDPGVFCLLRRCLNKDRHSRLQSIGDARIELEEVLGIKESTRVEPVPQSPWRNMVITLASVALLLGAFLSFGPWRAWIRTRTENPVIRFSIQLPADQKIVASHNPSLDISPDGRVLFYMVPAKISGYSTQIRMLDELEPKTLPAISGGCPVFSPDSKWVSFLDLPTRTIKRAALEGGGALTITTCEWMYRGDWGQDGYLYWTPATRSGIARTPISGGETQLVTELDSSRNEQSHRHARLLPGGNEIVFTAVERTMQSFDEAKIVVQSLKSGQRKTLVEGGTCPLYSPSGHLLYAQSGKLYAVPFDPKRLETTGPAVAVVEGLLMSTNTGAAYYSLSQTGTLVYVPGVAEGGERQLVWVDRQGKETPLALPPKSYLYPHLSPDGTKMAIEIEGPSHDFYVYDFARDVLTRMTHDGQSHAPVWSPDGNRLGFRSWKLGGMTLWSMPADRSAKEERMLNKKGMQSVVSWSPKGDYVAFIDESPKTRADVLVLPLKGERMPIPVATSEFVEGSPKFSPDGKWLAYCSNESGRPEVYVQPFPGPGPKIQISADGGNDPMWRRTGGEIFYRNGDKMMVVDVQIEPSFSAGRPRILWEAHYSHGMSSSCGAPGVTSFNYDVTADGSRFLMIKDVHQDVAATQIIVVLNWAAELSRLVKQKKT